ncbi:MAG: hypothetical protein ABJJ53_19335 [Sulfitobacter sp.]
MYKMVMAALIMLASPAGAQDKSFVLQAPDSLIQTGFLKHLLPRFSLKTGIRITVSEQGAHFEQGAQAFLGSEGTPVFAQADTLWHLRTDARADTAAFQTWLLSDVGKRTIEAFAPQGTPLFSADVAVAKPAQTATVTGDLVLGEAASLTHCGRCHVVNDINRMKAVESTPSFALMRTFPDWQTRFETFFLLAPHPAFTQVTGITAPFPEHLPSPMSPLVMTWEEVEAITAYAGSLPPADLGQPLQTQ